MTPEADVGGRGDDAPRVRRVDRRPAAPARPDLGGQGFAAALDVGGPPAPLVASVALWLAAAVAAASAVVVLWQEQVGVRARLAAVAVEQEPSVAADVVEQSARYAFLAGAGAVAVVAVVLVVLALALRTGRTWARPALVLAGAVGVVVAIAVQDLVADPARTLTADPARLALVAHAALVLAAGVAMFAPGATRWLRRARAVRR